MEAENGVFRVDDFDIRNTRRSFHTRPIFESAVSTRFARFYFLPAEFSKDSTRAHEYFWNRHLKPEGFWELSEDFEDLCWETQKS